MEMNQNQNFASQQNHNVKDPVDYYMERDNSKSNEGGGLGSFFLHDQVHACEVELQLLNSAKSDEGGTSVGISDATLRFLAIRSVGIIKTSMISLFGIFLLYFIIFIYINQLIAIAFALFSLSHTLYPGYIVYGMKRFISRKGKFTKPFSNKISNAWRAFEVIYIFTIIALIALLTRYKIVVTFVEESLNGNKYSSKIYSIFTSKIPLESFNGIYESFLFVMLTSLLIYIFVIKNRTTFAKEERKKINFEHSKETLRPLQLARIKCGKLKELE